LTYVDIFLNYEFRFCGYSGVQLFISALKCYHCDNQLNPEDCKTTMQCKDNTEVTYSNT